MQAYMRDRVMALAARPAKEEAIEQIETVLAKLSSPEPEARSALGYLSAERR